VIKKQPTIEKFKLSYKHKHVSYPMCHYTQQQHTDRSLQYAD